MNEYDENGNRLFPCRFEIGERVIFRIHGGENDGVEIVAYVRAVTFTSGKVRYALTILDSDPPESKLIEAGMGSTIHNVDSVLVYRHPEGRECIAFCLDNYS